MHKLELTQYIIDDQEEIKVIKYCLDYCFHRASKHKTPMTVFEDRINKLRQQFGCHVKSKKESEEVEYFKKVFNL